MESIQNSVQVDTPQPKLNYLIIIISSIFGIVLLALIFFLYFQNQQLKRQGVSQQASSTVRFISPAPQTTSSVSIPSDETVDWKTYTNLICKYTVKFPTDWEKVSDPFVGEESINLKPMSTNVISSSDRSINISATLLKKRPITNLQDEINGYNSFLWKNWTNKKIQNINFENVNAIKATGESYGVAHMVILLIVNNCYLELKGVGDYIQTFDQILSTFKFSEKNENQFCGGFAGAVCPEGYSCKYDGDYPDASGVCIKN